MSCNSSVPMASIVGKRIGHNAARPSRGKFLVTLATDSKKEAGPENEFINRPPRVAWSSDFWERRSNRSRTYPENQPPEYLHHSDNNAARHDSSSHHPQHDRRFSNTEAGRATRILSALSQRNQEQEQEQMMLPPLEQPPDQPLPTIMQVVAQNSLPRSAISKYPDEPHTIYGHPVEQWKLMVKKKKKRREMERAKLDSDLDESVYLNEEWKRKRMHWICTEIPRLDGMQTVKILNSQIKWIRNRDVSIICNRLLDIDHLNRAHRVLKWATQRVWFTPDFMLCSRLCEALAETGRVGRARDAFDLIIQHAYVPNESTYSAMVKAYLQDGGRSYIDLAWQMYKRMIDFAHYEPRPIVKNSMFKYLTESGKTSLKWVQRASEVFASIRSSNLPCTSEMYENLMTLYALKGDEEQVQFLVDDMKSQGLELTPLVFGAIVRACSRSGNYLRAEQVFQQMREARMGEELDWHHHIALMQAYGRAGLVDKAMGLFREMEGSPTFPRFQLFKTIIIITSDAGMVELTEELLGKLDPGMRSFQLLQPAFNSVLQMYSRKGLHDKVESTFEFMKLHSCVPNIESHNHLLQALVDSGSLLRAEEHYQKMTSRECIKPDYKSHTIMLGAYGKASQKKKLREVFRLLTEHKQPIPEEFRCYVEETIKPGWVEKARSYAQPRLTTTQRSIIAGVLLAGAPMTPKPYHLASLHFEQSAESFRGQVVMKNLHSLFSDWALQPPTVVTRDPSSGQLEVAPEAQAEENSERTRLLHFQTHFDVRFLFYYQQYRRYDRAVIPRLVHRWLTDATLAYWYMYSGYRSRDGRAIILTAAPYSYNELCLVIEAMHGRKIQCRIRRNSLDKCYLKFAGESALWLWKLMEEYIPEELFPMLKPGEGFEELLQLTISERNPGSGEEGDFDSSSDEEQDSDGPEVDGLLSDGEEPGKKLIAENDS